MNIRERMANNPTAALAVAVAILLVAAFLLFHQTFNSGPGRLKALYSDDDGKTWFRDDLRNLPPFDHHGKQAYRVQVFRCGNGKPFIGWMETYGDEDKKNLASTRGDDLALAAAMSTYQPRVKRPGESEWVTARKRSQYEAITTPRCPDGSQGTPQPIGFNE